MQPENPSPLPCPEGDLERPAFDPDAVYYMLHHPMKKKEVIPVISHLPRELVLKKKIGTRQDKPQLRYLAGPRDEGLFFFFLFECAFCGSSCVPPFFYMIEKFSSHFLSTSAV
ncbi:hypothetical protein TWF217_000836 [Orbilia oligospora]|nr:hypothetical protein TWF217_000836 [Orbilia oligospora]